MPELPEVETVRRTLEPAIGATITSVWSSGKGLHMQKRPPIRKLRALVGASLTAIRRHGKYLLFDTTSVYSIIGHLGMTGRFRIVPATEPRAKHTHFVLGLGDRDLRFIDARRFGQIDIVERAKMDVHPALSLLGPDPITHGLDAVKFLELAKAKRTTLKAFILDQSVIAGVGNIYASEALWHAKLRPTTRTHKLTAATSKALVAAVDKVLRDALENNGTSLRDFVDADGAEGSNWEYLKVYDRLGKPCPRCKSVIKRSVLQGRATYYCPTCQTP